MTGSRHVALSARSLVIYCRLLSWLLGWGSAIVGRTRSGIGSTGSRHVALSVRSSVIYCCLLSWLLGRGSAIVGRARIRRTASPLPVVIIRITLTTFDRDNAADQRLVPKLERLLQDIWARRTR